MSVDPDFSAKLRAERQRRRQLMRAEQKNDNEFKIDSKFDDEQRRQADGMAVSHCKQLNSEINESLDRTLMVCEQSSQIGADACDQLHDQRQKIKKIHKDVHETNEILKSAERNIQNASSWKKSVANFIRGPRKQKDYKGMKEDKDAPVTASKKLKHQNSNKKAKELKPVSTQHNKIATTEPQKTEKHEKYKQIDKYLDGLMEMTVSMDQEMQTQNKMLEELHEKTEDLQTSFIQKNRKIRKVLKE